MRKVWIVPNDAPQPKAWEQVVAWVEERILDGRFVRGSLLPPERELAAQLGVGRSAVREAVRTLQASGVLRSSVGAGHAGGTSVAGSPDVVLARLLSLHVALANFPPYDVTQVRVGLERISTSLAAQHATEGDLDRMRVPLKRMDDDDITRPDFNDADAEFHIAVARAAGNTLATGMTVAIRQSMRRPILEGITHVPDWPSLRAQLRAEHHAVMAALEARDSAGAADLMESHIWAAWRRMTAGGSGPDPAQPMP